MRPFGDARHAVGLLRRFGTAALVRRAAQATLRRVDDPLQDIGIRQEDLAAPLQPERLRPPAPRPRVTVVMTPPSRVSGGHMTIVRLVRRLIHAGMNVTLAIYDVYGGALSRQVAVINRLYPDLAATAAESVDRESAPAVSVVDALEAIPDSDALVATSWQTAHALSRREATGHRIYLIQDFEPWFYPRGDAGALAQSSYDLGFSGLAIGRTLADEIERRTPMRCDYFHFGCEMPSSQMPSLASLGPRVVFYARPGTPRRGVILGMLALTELQRRRPEIQIDIVGGGVSWPKLDAQWHGAVDPMRMTQIYAEATAGLCLSFTNISLVPFEMLAAGCPVVVNDTRFARGELPATCVTRTPAHPRALAGALAEEVDRASCDRRRLAQASAAVRPWQTTTDAAVEVIRHRVRRRKITVRHDDES